MASSYVDVLVHMLREEASYLRSVQPRGTILLTRRAAKDEFALRAHLNEVKADELDRIQSKAKK